MKIVVGSSTAALTVSNELQKLILQYRILFQLSLPKKARLLFLAGLIRQLVNRAEQIAAEFPRTDNPVVSAVTKTVCHPIVETGPPFIAFINRRSTFQFLKVEDIQSSDESSINDGLDYVRPI